MDYLERVDYEQPGIADVTDELSLWSAPFGLMLLDRVPMRPGSTILDAGSGTGFLTIEMAQRCGSGTRVIAVDPWAAAMDRLRRKVEQLQLENVTLIEETVERAGLPEASIDLIVSNLGVNNFEDVDGVLRELFHIAKPGARLYLTTNPEGHMAEFYEAFRDTLVELGQTDRLDRFDEHVRHRGTVESVTESLRRAGFDVVAVETGRFRLRFADGTALLRHHFIRLGFLQGWLAVVDPVAAASTFGALEDNLNRLARERGELSLTIPMACFEARRTERPEAKSG